MAVKEKVLDLANHISGTKRGSKNEIIIDFLRAHQY